MSEIQPRINPRFDCIYIAKETFQNGTKSLAKGQRFQFVRSGYERYDGEYIFQFKELESGAIAELWIRDNMSFESWRNWLSEYSEKHD